MNAPNTAMTRPLIDVWVKFARESIDVAKALLAMDFKPYNPICYHTVTAAEKYMKLYLHNQGVNVGKTKDLLQILKYCYNHNPSFESVVPAIIVLNSFSIAGIHPEELGSETVERFEAAEAIQAAEDVEHLVKKVMHLE